MEKEEREETLPQGYESPGRVLSGHTEQMTSLSKKEKKNGYSFAGHKVTRELEKKIGDSIMNTFQTMNLRIFPDSSYALCERPHLERKY